MASGNEFKFFGQSMENVAVIFGGILVAWAILVSIISQSSSITSMLPAFFGVPIAFMGFISLKYPQKQKVFMHIAVVFGLFIFIGGLDFFRSLSSEGVAFNNPWAAVSKLFMMVSGFGFCYLCVKSFIHVRRMREANKE